MNLGACHQACSLEFYPWDSWWMERTGSQKLFSYPHVVHPYLWRHTCTHTHTYTEYKIYLKIFVLQKLFLSAPCFWLSLIYVFNQCVLVAPVKGIAAAFKLITDLVTTGALGSRFSSHVRPHPFPSCFHFCKGGACRQKEGKRRLNTKAHFLNFLMVISKRSAVRSHWARIGS